MSPALWTVKQAANQLNVSDRTVWAWVYARKLESVRLGRSVRIPQTTIDKLIQQGTMPARG
jgi:excisionase family DNA binding protein